MNPNQVLFSSELAARDTGLILKVLLNPMLKRDASHPCLISTWPKKGWTIVCVIPEQVSKTAVHRMHYTLLSKSNKLVGGRWQFPFKP